MKLTIDFHNMFRKKIIKGSCLAELIIILTMIVQLIGCNFRPDPLPTNLKSESKIRGNNEELEQNRELWLNSKISNYNFVIFKWNMADSWFPYLIKVRANQVASKTPVDKPQPMSRIDRYDDFETVEKIFNQIQEASNKGYRVDVKYNKNFGYPEKIIIDDHKALTDTLVSFEITKFEVIKDN